MGLEAKDMNVAVVGMGYWGPNLVRVFREMGVRVFLHDHDPERLRTAVERFPDCTPKERLEEILDDPAISAVALAVPLQHH
jgi:predicted dehydrogenase